MNIGINPTINDLNKEEKKYEVHLFDFDQNLYNENVSVLFRKFIREEKTFDNLDALKLQIQADEKNIRKYFNIHCD